MELGHEEVEGIFGLWFVDRGWVPCLTEIGIGEIKGVPPENLRGATPEQLKKYMNVWGSRGWIADVAGTMHSTSTRINNLGLARVGRELREHHPVTWLAEIKVTRQDFLGDAKWTAPPQTNLQFVCYPRGLISPEEIPDGWGGLELLGRSRVKKHMQKVVVNTISSSDTAQILECIAWSLWWRRCHDVVNAMEAKKASQARAVKQDSRRVTNIIEAVLYYMEDAYKIPGEKREDRGLQWYLKMQRVRRELPEHLIKHAARIRSWLVIPDPLAGGRGGAAHPDKDRGSR